MPGEPLLTTEAVREWAGDFEIGKGRPYSEGAAVGGTVRTGDTLRASVKGTRARPYRVRAVLAGGAVSFATCSCPVGYYGKCKHVAAVLLAYLENPGRFAELGDPAADLNQREKPELVALVLELLRRRPELEPVLAEPLPGFAARVAPDPEPFRRRAADILRWLNPADDWTREDAAEGLSELMLLGQAFLAAGEPGHAAALHAGVGAAVREFDGNLDDVFRTMPDATRRMLAEWVGVAPAAKASEPPPF